jgi:hypothetical protein
MIEFAVLAALEGTLRFIYKERQVDSPDIKQGDGFARKLSNYKEKVEIIERDLDAKNGEISEYWRSGGQMERIMVVLDAAQDKAARLYKDSRETYETRAILIGKLLACLLRVKTKLDAVIAPHLPLTESSKRQLLEARYTGPLAVFKEEDGTNWKQLRENDLTMRRGWFPASFDSSPYAVVVHKAGQVCKIPVTYKTETTAKGKISVIAPQVPEMRFFPSGDEQHNGRFGPFDCFRAICCGLTWLLKEIGVAPQEVNQLMDKILQLYQLAEHELIEMNSSDLKKEKIDNAAALKITSRIGVNGQSVDKSHKNQKELIVNLQQQIETRILIPKEGMGAESTRDGRVSWGSLSEISALLTVLEMTVRTGPPREATNGVGTRQLLTYEPTTQEYSGIKFPTYSQENAGQPPLNQRTGTGTPPAPNPEHELRRLQEFLPKNPNPPQANEQQSREEDESPNENSISYPRDSRYASGLELGQVTNKGLNMQGGDTLEENITEGDPASSYSSISQAKAPFSQANRESKWGSIINFAGLEQREPLAPRNTGEEHNGSEGGTLGDEKKKDTKMNPNPDE